MCKKILVIPDTQIRPDNLELNRPLMQSLGRMIVKERPDVVIHLGDHWDMYSLNTYDMTKNNKKTFDGDAVVADVYAGTDAMWEILAPLQELQDRQRENKHRVYKPEMYFIPGNHEERILRFPELRSLVSLEGLLAGMPFEMVPYLQPLEVSGILFCHYFYNPMSGRPFGGSAEYRLNKIKQSFVQGHEQSFKYASEYLSNGKVLQGLVGGACYLHDETYKGHQGNNHYRGAFLLKNAEEGSYDLEQVSVNRIMETY